MYEVSSANLTTLVQTNCQFVWVTLSLSLSLSLSPSLILSNSFHIFDCTIGDVCLFDFTVRQVIADVLLSLSPSLSLESCNTLLSTFHACLGISSLYFSCFFALFFLNRSSLFLCSLSLSLSLSLSHSLELIQSSDLRQIQALIDFMFA